VRVALCSVGELFGGVERQILDLCRYLRRNARGPHLIALFHDAELAHQLRDAGFAPLVLRARHRYDPQLATRLAEALAERRISIVHAHGYKAVVASGLAKRRHPHGLISTIHGKLEVTLATPVAWVKSQLNLRLEREFTTRYVDAVCYVTEDIARHYKQPHGDLVRRVVPNGIDPLDRSTYPRPRELARTAFNVGIVGRVSRVKGIAFAIEALTDPALPSQVRLTIIGTGPSEGELRRLAAQRGVGERVEFLGFRGNIYDYLAHLDALLMPSYHEGLPYTLLEAMSLARPIVASRVGGLAEVLEDGVTGVLVPVGDVAAVVAAVKRLVEDRKRAAAMGFAAAQVQRRQYTLDVMGETYCELYERLAAKPTAKF
jgi:glycosyltransferase involved in cell wall biosynthesis